ncbi:MAG: ADP-polyphosphate phosphotransferase [Burkholderiaceae bacterium]|jgi:PPK2 family polyphosphate:nucleotide phosphotransferase
MKMDLSQFRVKQGTKVNLSKWPTRTKPVYNDKAEYAKILAKHVAAMSDLQERLYAANRYALLIIFQAMDAAGKDGAIKHVMSGVNPQGCEVHSYKHPSPNELQHDFLWRTNLDLPARGRIGIFNRSYYEEVLIVRVHPEILQGEGLDDEEARGDRVWKDRFRSINDSESHLYRNGTVIIKFFLHLSKEEQRKRFLERIDQPDKNWKFSMNDVQERKYWDDYVRAYESCISATSTDLAPWYIVPADDKANSRLIVSRAILDTLKRLKLEFPPTDPARRKELLEIRKALVD